MILYCYFCFDPLFKKTRRKIKVLFTKYCICFCPGRVGIGRVKIKNKKLFLAITFLDTGKKILSLVRGFL